MRKQIILSIAAVLALARLVGGAGAWIVFGPNTPVYSGTRSVKIRPRSDFDAIVDSLDAAGVIQWDQSFRWVARATGRGGQVTAGHDVSGARLSNSRILNRLRRGL